MSRYQGGASPLAHIQLSLIPDTGISLIIARNWFINCLRICNIFLDHHWWSSGSSGEIHVYCLSSNSDARFLFCLDCTCLSGYHDMSGNQSGESHYIKQEQLNQATGCEQWPTLHSTDTSDGCFFGSKEAVGQRNLYRNSVFSRAYQHTLGEWAASFPSPLLPSPLSTHPFPLSIASRIERTNMKSM